MMGVSGFVIEMILTYLLIPFENLLMLSYICHMVLGDVVIFVNDLHLATVLLY